MKKGTNLRSLIDSGSINRKNIYTFYMNKYYNLFMNAYKWNGLDYQQRDYIMRKFWSDGTIAAFKIANIEELAFAPYAAFTWNLYGYAEEVTLVNERGVPFIPDTPQIVDKDVALGWCQRNKKSVASVVDLFANKLADVEMTIRTNIKVHKTPWLIGVSPEDKERVKNLFNKLSKDDSELYVELEDTNNFKALVSGAPYITDKLYGYKCALENELKEYLGITNLGNQEKKEHLITTEVNANNEITESSGDCFYDMLVEFTERVRDVLGFDISVELNKPDQYYDPDSMYDNKQEEAEVEKNVQIRTTKLVDF